MNPHHLNVSGHIVQLRLLTAEDAPALLNYLVRNRSFHEPFSPARDPSYYTLENARAIADQQELVRSDRQYAFGLFEPDSGRLVGKFRLSNIVRAAFQNAYLGYDVDESVCNRGFATEAVKLVVALAFCELGLHRIQAAVMPRNTASQRVLEKAGFLREGFAQRYLQINNVWEDHLLYAITAERWTRLAGGRPGTGVE